MDMDTLQKNAVLADILDITFSDMGFIVFLKPSKEEEEESLAVPIFVGIPEAQAIAIQFNKIRSPRPLMMDLAYNILGLLNTKVVRVVISDLIDKTFYAKIHLEDHKGVQYLLDARSSDALILALRFNAPIYLYKNIIKEAGVYIKKESVVPQQKENQKSFIPKTQLQLLEEALKKALEQENYEEAARLRDEIKKHRGETN